MSKRIYGVVLSLGLFAYVTDNPEVFAETEIPLIEEIAPQSQDPPISLETEIINLEESEPLVEIPVEPPLEIETEPPIDLPTEPPIESEILPPSDVITDLPLEAPLEIPITEAPIENELPPQSDLTTDLPPEVPLEIPVTETPTENELIPQSDITTDLPPEVPLEIPVTETPAENELPSQNDVTTDLPLEEQSSENNAELPLEVPITETNPESEIPPQIDVPTNVAPEAAVETEEITLQNETLSTETNTTLTTPLEETIPVAMNALSDVSLTAVGPSQVVNSVNTNKKVASLTISGVTSDAHVDAILANLATLQTKATFFINGGTSQAAISKIVAAGHDIGNQAFSGSDVTTLTQEQLINEMTAIETAVQSASGATPKPLFRAPAGNHNPTVLETVGGMGYGYTVGWSVDPWDWSGISANEIFSNVTNNLKGGSIILLDASATATGTPAAILDIINRARALGYNFTSIEELLSYEGVFEEEPLPVTPSQVVNSVNTNKKVASLTISGVTNDAHVDAILANLATLQTKATFFINGGTSQAAISKIVAAGHDIGNQASSGTDVTTLTTDQLMTEIKAIETAVQTASGATPKPLFRAPAGNHNPTVLKTVNGMGYGYTVGWSVDPWDWSGISANEIFSNVTNNLKGGSIILLDASATATGTPAAILDIINRARALGYNFTSIEELLSYEGVFEEEPLPVTPSQVVNSVNTNKRVASLTISGVTNDAHIDAILANLATLQTKATFFINGGTSQAAIAKIVAAGHDIGNQASSGTDVTTLTTDQLMAEIKAIETAVQTASGATPKPLFRAPAGNHNPTVLKTVNGMGYGYTVGWSVDPWDWSGISAGEISANVSANLKGGSIILLDASATATGTPAALLEIVNRARALGYSFTSIEELLTYEGVFGEEPPPATFSTVVNSVNTNKRVASLTISGLTNDAHIDAILANLATLQTKATFFINGGTSQAAIAKIVAAGHDIGNQASSGTNVTTLTTDQLMTEIKAIETAVQTASGATPKPLFRAPGGIHNDTVLKTVGGMGYGYTVGWSVDPWDWSGISSGQISAAVADGLKGGSIILLDASDNATGTPGAILDIINNARALGYSFTSIEELLTYEGVIVDEPPVTTPSKWIDQVNTNQKVLSLTFDDGNNDLNLEKILDYLLLYDVKASFFLNGSTNPDLLRRVVNEGHHIGNHTYYHRTATEETREELIEDITLLEQYILETTGVSTKPYFRAPGGHVNAAVLETVGSLGYTHTFDWSVDPQDWSGKSGSEITSILVNDLAPGSIFLLHASDTAIGTPDALLEMIPFIKSQGYEFKTLVDLMSYEGDYSVPSDGFVIPKLVPFEGVTNPIFTKYDIPDVTDPVGVADPFIFLDNGTYHLFFEVIDYENENGSSYSSDKIAHAWSTDLLDWNYTEVVISQENNGARAAYPSVFTYDNKYYVVPDSAGDIRAYVANDFPSGWTHEVTLMEGAFVDTNIFQMGETWYMTTSRYPYNSLSLYYNTSGDWRNDQWQLHPIGNIVQENSTEKGYRGAGNPFVYDDHIILPVQVTPTNTGIYGEKTYWYKLSDLSSTSVSVERLGLAMGPTHDDTWTDLAVHHIAHAPYGDDYIYVVDGYSYIDGVGEYRIGLFVDANAPRPITI